MAQTIHHGSNIKVYQRLLENPKINMVIGTGPAGTGKTKTPCVVGLNHLVDRTYDRMILTRPTVTVGNEQIGFLPGDLDDKMGPWVTHMMDYVNNYNLRFIEGKVDVVPLGFIRGETWHDRYIIADEMQNSTIMQMKTLLTRIGENTKLVITGDLSQSDLEQDENGLSDLLRRLDDSSFSLYDHVEFTENDVVRSEFVKQILSLYRLN